MTYIYALTTGGYIVYIGQTTNIKIRMYQHSLNNKLPGADHIILETCEDKDGLNREKFYIKKYIAEGHELYNVFHAKDNRLDDIDMSILQLLADDKKAKQMSGEIWLSCRTIETRIQRIKKKIGAKHLGGLIYKAYKKGLVK